MVAKRRAGTPLTPTMRCCLRRRPRCWDCTSSWRGGYAFDVDQLMAWALSRVGPASDAAVDFRAVLPSGTATSDVVACGLLKLDSGLDQVCSALRGFGRRSGRAECGCDLRLFAGMGVLRRRAHERCLGMDTAQMRQSPQHCRPLDRRKRLEMLAGQLDRVACRVRWSRWSTMFRTRPVG